MPNELTVELITQLIANSTAPLVNEIQRLKHELESKDSQVIEYETQTIDESIKCDEALDVIKSLPDFSGRQNQYVSWREAAYNSISLYKKGSRKYFAALTILRNKITQYANDVLTNHGTVLNFEAIIARLDFAYSDRRPIHIVEEELSVLRQGSMSVIDFYNAVNKKLTLLINKTIMTHGTNNSVTKELNIKNRAYALRVFITGLNPPLSNIIHSMSPIDLPNALAKAQELESNEQRALFTEMFYSHKNYSKNQNKNYNSNNYTNYNNNYNNNKGKNISQNQKTNQNNNTLRYPKREPNQIPVQTVSNQREPVPMEVDPSIQMYQQPTHFNHSQNYSGGNPNQFHSEQKRNFQKRNKNSTQSNQPQPKAQRINNITENHFLEDSGQSDCPTYSRSTERQEKF